MKSSTNTVLLLECLFRTYGFPEFIESETGQYTLEIDDILFYFIFLMRKRAPRFIFRQI